MSKEAEDALLKRVREAVIKRDRYVAEIVRKGSDLGIPITELQARHAYDTILEIRFKDGHPEPEGRD